MTALHFLIVNIDGEGKAASHTSLPALEVHSFIHSDVIVVKALDVDFGEIMLANTLPTLFHTLLLERKIYI